MTDATPSRTQSETLGLPAFADILLPGRAPDRPAASTVLDETALARALPHCPRPSGRPPCAPARSATPRPSPPCSAR